jgi:alpha-glucosidase (family GH31 glycosyl hydrolase)
MENYRDFTVDPVNFADLGDFVEELHSKKHMRYIPIIDAGIS